MRLKIQLRSSIHYLSTVGAALLYVFLPTSIIHAQAQTTYYVATTGNDSNNGSITSPWATPQHSSTIAKPGDTVIIEDGTYNLGSGGGTGDWRIPNGGTASLPVTYMAQHKWQAKLVGHGSGDGTTAIGLAGGYTIIKDFDITGSDANGINITTNGTAASYNQVVTNYIHDMVTPCDGNSGAAVTSGSGGNNYAGVGHEFVTGNLIVNLLAAGGCPGGHQASAIAMMLPNGVVANNIVMNCGDAIEAWHAATNITFFGNVVLNSGRGLSMGAGDAPGGITNNNSLVENNIIVNGSGPAIIETGGTGKNNVYRDNLIFGGDTSIELSNGLTATGTINANPQFVNNTGTASGDYRLQASSPARGAGIALAGITSDFLGDARPQSGTTDIGACLFGATASTPPSSSTPTPPADSTPTTPSGSVAAGIAASATSISAGGSATLAWSSKNAVSGDLNGSPVPLSGTMTVRPTTTTTYRFTARNSSGATDWGQVTITVTAATSGPVAAGISASATSITKGQSSVLSWTTTNAVSANLNGRSVALNGALTVQPISTATYRITAVDSKGKTDWGSTTISVR